MNDDEGLGALEHDQGAAARWDGVVRIRKPQPVTEVPSTFDDTDWSRWLLGAVSSGEAVRGAVVRNHEQVQRLRAQLANAERRAGHTNGRPIDPPCGYCELATQCERCAEIVRSCRAEQERDQARARVAELEAQVREQHEVLREQGSELRGAEQDAYNAWCRDH